MSAEVQPNELQRIASGERLCGYCGQPFPPRRAWALFCSDKCRASYDEDIGTSGKVAHVKRLSSGRVSVTIHFHGVAEERALKLVIGDDVRAVKQP